MTSGNETPEVFSLRYNLSMSKVLSWVSLESDRKLEIVAGDLTEEQVDVIVNAANQWLEHGAGVARIIVQRGGESIQSESYKWVSNHGHITHEHPAYTNAGGLPCRYVIHAVGPVWGEGQEYEKLQITILGVLNLASLLGVKTLAIPPISTGIYGFPKERAASVFFETIHEFWMKNPESTLRCVRLTIIDEPTVAAFLNAFNDWKKETNSGNQTCI
jgi:O-acetyl-ADP-ribose deacetylase (regulator of RNase III)